MTMNRGPKPGILVRAGKVVLAVGIVGLFAARFWKGAELDAATVSVVLCLAAILFSLTDAIVELRSERRANDMAARPSNGRS